MKNTFLSKLSSLAAVLALMMYVPLSAAWGPSQQQADRSFSELTTLSQSTFTGNFMQFSAVDDDCLNSSAYLSGTAPEDGSILQVSSCTYPGDYTTINGVISGHSYEFTGENSTYGNLYLTIREGTYDGPVVMKGVSPLVYEATSFDNLYLHWTINEDCDTASSCSNIYIQDLGGEINWECSGLEMNIGDNCTTAGSHPGTVDAECNCVADEFDLCGQGDDSNGLENGLNITAYLTADDFFVGSGETLNILSIEFNIFTSGGIGAWDINFYDDAGGSPGALLPGYSQTGLTPSSTTLVGDNFGYDVYTVVVPVNLSFPEGHYWMAPIPVGGGDFWEVTSAGGLGNYVHMSSNNGASWYQWENDSGDNAQAVFKLHCDEVPVDWDCDDLEANIGDSCTTDGGEAGTINEDCDCEVPAHPCDEAITMLCDTDYNAVLNPGEGVWTNYTGVPYTYTGSEQVFVFTAPEAGVYVFHANEGAADADFFLMDGCSSDSGNLLGSTYIDGGSFDNQANLTLTPGQTVYLIADLYQFASVSTTVTVSVTCPDGPQPVGDCVFFTSWGSTTAPAAGESVTSNSCNFAGDFHSLYGAEDGIEYTVSTQDGDYLTVRSGVYTGSIIAQGFSPLTFTADGEDLFVHIAADEFCSSENACRNLTVEREGAAGEYCDWRIRVWGNNGLGVEWTLTDGNGDVVDSSPDGGWGSKSISYLSGTYNLVEPVTFTLNADTSGDYQSVNYYLLRNGGKIEHGRARDQVIEHTRYCSDDADARSGMTASMSDFDFTYHPNPVKDVLYINSVKDVKEVKVYNMAGQQMLNFDKGLSVKNELDVTRLPNGVYVFRAVLEDGQVETFKVVKK